MAYIEREGMEARFGADEIGQLLDDNRDDSESSPEASSLTEAIADADATINGYLATRYTLPLSSVPDLVVGWAADIARFRLWDEQAPEEVRRRYDDALTQLRDLARGLISLPPGADGETAGVAGFASDGFASDRVFTMDSLTGF